MSAKALLVIILAGLGCLLLILATLAAGGVIVISGANWLLSGGLATWCVAWFVSLLPIP
jgi:hypothetical protein